MDEKTYQKQRADELAKEILTLARNTLLVNLRFLDAALSQFEFFPIEESTLLTDGKHILYNPRHILENYKTAKEIPVRDYLHMVMHCVFKHMYMDPSLNRPYWDLACDIAVENVITELGLKAVSCDRERKQVQYIAAVKHKNTFVNTFNEIFIIFIAPSDTYLPTDVIISLNPVVKEF